MLERAKVRWDKNTPYSDEFDDIYFSRFGGREESEHIFLGVNQLPKRFRELEASDSRQFVIGELGFGTGLNFFLTWKLWAQTKTANVRLHFVSFELAPVSREDMLKAYEGESDLLPFVKRFLVDEPHALPGYHRINFEPDGVSLTLIYGNFAETHADFEGGVDAWFLDGFNPKNNSLLWNEEAIEFISRCSKRNATAATYSVSGALRRLMQNHGWMISKLPGIGRKREVMCAVRKESLEDGTSERRTEPWFDIPRVSSRPSSVLILGAGIAGATSANALARRGVPVTIVDSSTAFSQASGNHSAIVLPYLSADEDRRHLFFLQAFAYSSRFYRSLNVDDRSSLWNECGVLFSPNAKRISQLRNIVHTLPDELARVYSANEILTEFGLKWNRDAVFFPTGGVVYSDRLRQRILHDPLITVKENHSETKLVFENNNWTLFGCDREIIAKAEVVILATGAETNMFPVASAIETNPVWGETFQIPSGSGMKRLKHVLCTDVYITPDLDGAQVVGATHLRARPTRDTLNAERKKLAERLLAFADDEFDANALDLSQGRLSARAATYDRLPFIGPLPDKELFLQAFHDLRKGFPIDHYPSAPLHPNCFVTTGHGSRGYVTAPFAAELLSSMILNEPLPIERWLLSHVLPSRFLVRKLRTEL